MPQHGTDELEAKHGMPLNQITGKVYALHYEVPQLGSGLVRGKVTWWRTHS